MAFARYVQTYFYGTFLSGEHECFEKFGLGVFSWMAHFDMGIGYFVGYTKPVCSMVHAAFLFSLLSGIDMT
jgi:hypothetical protein